MLVDTHCHINMMVKDTFDIPLSQENINAVEAIVTAAQQHDVTTIINVGTSIQESKNCVTLAHHYPSIWASIGLHPNDCTPAWRKDIQELTSYLAKKQLNKIVAIGECGLDRHYPDYDLPRQKDAFKAQIELALEHELALVVHTRDAYDETLRMLDEYKHNITRGVIHCFSEDQQFADTVIAWGFCIGLGGIITYPKNHALREIAKSVPAQRIVLETDAPFLPPQPMRGKQNHPSSIRYIAEYIADLRGVSYEELAQVTTKNALALFGIGN